MKPTGVFVYGTLLAGASHGGMLAGFPRYAARVRGHLFDLPEGYPAMVLAEGEDWTYGELVEGVPDRIVELVDTYEGVEQGLFQRVPVEAWLGLRPVAAWSWVMDGARRRGVRVPSGRWRRSRRR